MTRFLFAGTLAATLGAAPFQCKHDPDPNLRQEDTAGDALWALAQKFKAEKNDAAAKETFKYLVERYPSSRYATAAKDELGVGAGSAGANGAGADGG